MNYYLHILVMLEIYMLLALSLNQKVGLSGLLSLGQAVFYGLGAYITAISLSSLGLSYWSGVLLSIMGCGFLAMLFSFIAERVRDLYFSLATLALQIIFFSIIYNWVAITNGSYGISGIARPSIWGFVISTPFTFSILGGTFVILIVGFYSWFLKTPVCRLIEATRDDKIAVINLGKNPNYYIRISMVISAVIAGVAGSLYATYTTFIDPSSFMIEESILILSIVLIGGARGIIGPLAGTIIYIGLPEVLKALHMPNDIAANMRMIIFGLILILIVRFKPQGIFGKLLLK